SFRRTWHLPDGVTPLGEEHCRRLAGTEPGDPWQRLSAVLGSGREETSEESWQRRQALRVAVAAWQKQGRPGTDATLGEALSELAREALKGVSPLVVD